MTDLYMVLGLGRGCRQEDIKVAYRNRSRATHPDHGGDEAEFKRVAAAYAVLGDPEKREEYDRMGATGDDRPTIDILGILKNLFGSGRSDAPDLASLAQVLGRIAADADEAKRCAGDVANLVDLIRECGALGVDQGLAPAEDDDGDMVHLRAGVVALGDWFRGGSGQSPLQEPAPRAERRRKAKERR